MWLWSSKCGLKTLEQSDSEVPEVGLLLIALGCCLSSSLGGTGIDGAKATVGPSAGAVVCMKMVLPPSRSDCVLL